MAGIKDVAVKAGVSISTVSNVINNTKYVSPELRRKVEDAVRDLSYQANPAARSMKSKRTGIIGVITVDMCGMFYPYVMKGIYSVANERGYQVVICDSNVGNQGESDFQREKELFQNLFRSQVDGIIFTSVVPKSMEERYIRWLMEAAEEGKYIPFVSIERDFMKYGVDSIVFDGRRGAYKAVEHLIDCGCKEICHITGPSHMDIVNDRLNGYIEAMEDAGFVIDRNTMVVEGNFSHQSGYEGMKKLLEYIPDVDGVFAGNDQMAVGIMKALKESKIKVPEEIKIAGFDDVYVSSVLEPPLTTVHIEKRELGIAAAKILFDRIDEGGRRREVRREVIDNHLVIRQSTVKDASEDWISTEW